MEITGKLELQMKMLEKGIKMDLKSAYAYFNPLTPEFSLKF